MISGVLSDTHGFIIAKRKEGKEGDRKERRRRERERPRGKNRMSIERKRRRASKVWRN